MPTQSFLCIYVWRYDMTVPPLHTKKCRLKNYPVPFKQPSFFVAKRVTTRDPTAAVVPPPQAALRTKTGARDQLGEAEAASVHPLGCPAKLRSWPSAAAARAVAALGDGLGWLPIGLCGYLIGVQQRGPVPCFVLRDLRFLTWDSTLCETFRGQSEMYRPCRRCCVGTSSIACIHHLRNVVHRALLQDNGFPPKSGAAESGHPRRRSPINPAPEPSLTAAMHRLDRLQLRVYQTIPPFPTQSRRRAAATCRSDSQLFHTIDFSPSQLS